MKYVDTDFNHISILDEFSVLIEAIDGVSLGLEKEKHACDLIEKEMPNNYALIIDRKEDYSIASVDFYKVMNGYGRLKAIAIVLLKKRNFLPVTTEKKLFKGELEVFKTIKEAHEWVSQVVNKFN